MSEYAAREAYAAFSEDILALGSPLGRRAPLPALYKRLAASLLGDPCGYAVVASTGSTDVHGLARNDLAVAVVAYVSGGSIIYRVDGTLPAAAGDQLIQAGSTITLTGFATLQGFQFAGAAGAATLFLTYYD